MGTCKQLKSKLSERQMPWQKAETDPHSFLLPHRGPKSGLGLLRPNSGARWHSSSEGPKNQGAQRPGTSRPHFRPTSPGLQDRGAGGLHVTPKVQASLAEGDQQSGLWCRGGSQRKQRDHNGCHGTDSITWKTFIKAF